MNPYNLDFNSDSIKPCLIDLSLTECKLSNVLRNEFIAGIIFCLPIFYFLVKLIRSFIMVHERSGIMLIQFLLFSMLFYTFSILRILFPKFDYSYVYYFYQLFSFLMNSISYVTLGELALITLRITGSKYSKILGYGISIFKYICFAFVALIVFINFIAIYISTSVANFSVYFQVILILLNYLVEVLVLTILIETYIFNSAVRKLIGKKIIVVLYFLIFVIVFFKFMVVLYNYEDIEKIIYLLAINKGLNFAMIVRAILHFIVYYMPRITQTIAMWVLYYGSLENEEDTPQIDDIISEALIK